MSSIKTMLQLGAFGLLALNLSGCALGAAAGAGAIAADELNEAKRCDDGFDPLEDVRGEGDGCT